MRIQHVSVPRPPGVESRNKAHGFYVGLLGLAEKPVPMTIQHLDLVWFEVGDTELHCFAEEPINDPSGRHFCLEVNDLEAMRRRLIEAGYKPWDPEKIRGRPRFFCRDPFNNTIEFTEIVGNYLELENELGD